MSIGFRACFAFFGAGGGSISALSFVKDPDSIAITANAVGRPRAMMPQRKVAS